MNSRCYLCLQETKYKDALLCTNCYCKIQDYQFLACARCGNLSCSGCDELIEFTKVTSLYLYKDTLAHILILAKEDNNINAQKLFTELFFVPVKNSILKLMQSKNYAFIVLSPLRKDRIFHGAWHPNVFYDEVLNYIYEYELPEIQKPQILYPHYSHKKKKQSLIPVAKREKQQKDTNFELIYPKIIQLPQYEKEEEKKVLLLDDVLTSGETSLLCKRLSQYQISPAVWDLFTIFRAPRISNST
ncbi:MAG: phosphoribosyltransferase [Bdellovibrionota bacterium]